MSAWIVSLFVLVHGLAHVVYTAVARGWIPSPENQPDMTGSSWLLAAPLGTAGSRDVGAAVFTGVTLAFAVAAVGLGLRQAWAPGFLGVCAVASSIALLVFWDGRLSNLVTQGFLGLIINLALLAGLYFRWPALAS